MFSLAATSSVEAPRADAGVPRDSANVPTTFDSNANRLVPGVPRPPGAQFLPNELAQADWSIVASPNNSTTQNNLLGVTCVSASDCWAVGFYVAGSGAPRTLVEHWNGASWAIVPSPNASLPNNVLNAVACASASDCWAVGYYITGPSAYQTLIERWDGTSWTIVPRPTPRRSTNSTP